MTTDVRADEDRAAIGASKPKGVLRSVAAVPFNLVQGTVKLARTSSGGSLPPSDQACQPFPGTQ